MLSQSSKANAAEVRVALERVLASRCFERAGRSSALLRFLVDQTLASAGSRLTGYTIGVEVFGRGADFDAQNDPLVRVEAGRLRHRLVQYYATEGSVDDLRIELPRGTYSVVFHRTRAARPGAPAALSLRHKLARWWNAAAVAVVLAAAALGLLGWQRWTLREAEPAPDAPGALERTEWPRLVVVPFENLSNDPQLDRLAASITEEVMLALDQLDLTVVATRASWYAGRADADDLRAGTDGYVLTGSVRGNAERTRVTVRLIEARTNLQLWSAAYDRLLEGEALPEIHERVARDVAAIAAPYGPIFQAELGPAQAPGAPRLSDCFAKYYHYRRRIDAVAHRDALTCFRNLSDRRPDSAHVWAGLAMLHLDEYGFRFTRDPDTALAAARDTTARALGVDRNNFHANLALMRLQFYEGDPAFRDGVERTIALRGGHREALVEGGILLVIGGDPAHGLSLVEQAQALSKRPLGIYSFAYAVTYLREGHCEAALSWAQQIDTQNWIGPQVALAAAAGLCGREDVAREAAHRILELHPDFEAEASADLERWGYDRVYRERAIGGLRAAGLRIED